MRRLRPFIISIVIVIADQLSKALVVRYIPEGTIGAAFFGDFLWICHVRNDAVAFSLGQDFPLLMKYLLFVVLPLAIMAVIAWAIISGKMDREIDMFQRWCLAGIFGGGVGNLIDRLFRSLRVVDWISTNNYGFLGMERFPTYNIADAAVVISVILLLGGMLLEEGRKKNEQKR